MYSFHLLLTVIQTMCSFQLVLNVVLTMCSFQFWMLFNPCFVPSMWLHNQHQQYTSIITVIITSPISSNSPLVAITPSSSLSLSVTPSLTSSSLSSSSSLLPSEAAAELAHSAVVVYAILLFPSSALRLLLLLFIRDMTQGSTVTLKVCSHYSWGRCHTSSRPRSQWHMTQHSTSTLKLRSHRVIRVWSKHSVRLDCGCRATRARQGDMACV